MNYFDDTNTVELISTISDVFSVNIPYISLLLITLIIILISGIIKKQRSLTRNRIHLDLLERRLTALQNHRNHLPINHHIRLLNNNPMGRMLPNEMGRDPMQEYVAVPTNLADDINSRRNENLGSSVRRRHRPNCPRPDDKKSPTLRRNRSDPLKMNNY
ncbi:unnamed protein product [Gordionus sp. m RMFG-2023]